MKNDISIHTHIPSNIVLFVESSSLVYGFESAITHDEERDDHNDARG